MTRVALRWPPGSEYTVAALRRAFAGALPDVQLITEVDGRSFEAQVCDYDLIDWDAAQEGCLTSAYAIRKALTRKHHLPLTIAQHVAKHPDSVLKAAVPTTWTFELAFADELDELWADELYELKEALDGNTWFLLKPGMADKGQGIRLFHTQEQLEGILADFEAESDEEDEESESTAVSLSRMRWWVVQRYIERPLLVDNRKFHLRAYVLAVGALQVYLYTDMLALFAASEYAAPTDEADEVADLTAHLTNTCLQDPAALKADSIRRFRDLPMPEQHRKEAIDRIAQVIGETWRAALGAGTQFQPLPNAFELYGVDLLLDEDRQPHLLEVNAGPDFKQTGDELAELVDNLFVATLQIAVKPHISDTPLGHWAVGDESWQMRKCLDERVRSFK